MGWENSFNHGKYLTSDAGKSFNRYVKKLQPLPFFATTGAGFATSIAAELRPTTVVAFFVATVVGFWYYRRWILLHPSWRSCDRRRDEFLLQPSTDFCYYRRRLLVQPVTQNATTIRSCYDEQRHFAGVGEVDFATTSVDICYNRWLRSFVAGDDKWMQLEIRKLQPCFGKATRGYKNVSAGWTDMFASNDGELVAGDGRCKKASNGVRKSFNRQRSMLQA